MRKSARLGFTLVELLVVIAIIGVLAAVLLIGINPIEQINKTKDAGKLSRAKEAISAAERYYAARAGATYTEPDCAALVTALELKTGACGSGTTLVVLAGSAGSYTATFTPESATYKTKCGCAVGDACINGCLVPTEFQ